MKNNDSLLSERVHYLDALRGILMMLGVLYHSALVFSPDSNWAIHSVHSTIMAFYIHNAISFFRMPAFFIISGYFVLFTILKYGPDLFLKVRLKRILIPLFTTALTLNIIQSILIEGNDWQLYYFHKGWISHLWFLWNLVVYFIFVYVVCKFLKIQDYRVLKKLEENFFKINIVLILLILPAFNILFLVVGKLLPDDFFGIKVSSILYYFPYFIFGMLLLRNNILLKRFANIRIEVNITIIILSYYLYTIFINFEGNLFLAVSLYFKALSAWFGSAMSFYIFMKFFNTSSKLFYFLADVSYTVYLFHHVLVIGFGLILINLNIGGIAGLLLLIISTLVTSIFIHISLISKIKILKFLFNGK